MAILSIPLTAPRKANFLRHQQVWRQSASQRDRDDTSGLRVPIFQVNIDRLIFAVDGIYMPIYRGSPTHRPNLLRGSSPSSGELYDLVTTKGDLANSVIRSQKII